MEDSRSRQDQASSLDETIPNAVEVTIISAQGLKDLSRIFFRMSPYALAWMDPEDKYCTHVAHNAGTNPTWNHKLYVPLITSPSSRSLVPSPPSSRSLVPSTLSSRSSSPEEQAHVYIAIYNRLNRFGSDSEDPLLGTAKIPLCDILKDVQYMACQLQRVSGRIHGLLNISVRICHCGREALESSSFKRALEMCGSFKQKTPPSSDEDEDAEGGRKKRDVYHDAPTDLPEEDHKPHHPHLNNLVHQQLKFEDRLANQPQPTPSTSSSSAPTPSTRQKLTAPDILDFGQVEDPSNPQQQQQQQVRYGGQPFDASGGHHHGGGGGHNGDGTGDLATYYLGSQASAAMDSLAQQ